MDNALNPNGIKVGDQIEVEQAWEDAEGYFHDECPTVLAIDPGNGELTLDFGRDDLNEFLVREAQFFAKDYKPEGQT